MIFFVELDSINKIYRITPGHYLSSATNQFEADDEVASLLTDAGQCFVYRDAHGVLMDPRKSFDENGLVPLGPAGQGIRTLRATLVNPTNVTTNAH